MSKLPYTIALARGIGCVAVEEGGDSTGGAPADPDAVGVEPPGRFGRHLPEEPDRGAGVMGGVDRVCRRAKRESESARERQWINGQMGMGEWASGRIFLLEVRCEPRSCRVHG